MFISFSTWLREVIVSSDARNVCYLIMNTQETLYGRAMVTTVRRRDTSLLVLSRWKTLQSTVYVLVLLHLACSEYCYRAELRLRRCDKQSERCDRLESRSCE